MIPALAPSPLVKTQLGAAAGAVVWIKRDDLYSLAPGTALQGNKVRKLLPILRRALEQSEPPVLVSFGGAYSNHLSALASAGELYGLPVHLVVRGEEVDNPILRRAAAVGAQLQRISRADYRRRHNPDFLADLRRCLAAFHQRPLSDIWLVPEGGTSPAAVESCAAVYYEAGNQLGRPPDYFCLAAGTGGTAAGVISAAGPATVVEVFPALGGNWMADEIRSLLSTPPRCPWSCIPDYTFGGYGKFPAEWIVPSPGLATRADLGLPGLPPLEPIYTAKLFSGVLDRLRRGCYPAGANVVVLHTGGIY